VTSRNVPLATMVVVREPDQLYLLRHTGGEDGTSYVERIDPVSLEPLARSVDLPGGPTWPGSLAAHADGSLYVVFGNHAHRLDADLGILASTALPRSRAYNGFVILSDGTLVTKDFAGSRPERPVAPGEREPCQLLALEPGTLAVADRLDVPEPSVARLSADGDTVYVVGDTSLLRVRWVDGRLRLDEGFRARYRTLEGQTYGWDCVLALGAAWFLDDGEGSEGYAGTLRGVGRSTAPLHLVRVDLDTAAVTMAEVGEGPGGLVANPPVVDEGRRIAVGYDSGTGIVKAFDVAADGSLTERWRRHQDHASHLVLEPVSGVLVTGDHRPERGADDAVFLDVTTGAEVGRVATGSPIQGVLFPALGPGGDLYLTTFAALTRIATGT
jgi:hypothetical protein